eukprot:Phypoly_transcript_09799.p2 GENE.Phypoly_transcript_09799~~Phypoly_transcript_09799.p2  ORF type:complete len:137 (+),score=14.98 Phypoly_transcript_09799:946-1356(+)
MKVHAFRLLPGDDLMLGIEKFVNDNAITAGYIITCVGSVKELNLRLANTFDTLTSKEPGVTFEIVSLVGLISIYGGHLHMCVSDKEGKAFGGHIKPGNIVYTTAEIVLGELEDKNFLRQDCKLSGWPELVVEDKKK